MTYARGLLRLNVLDRDDFTVLDHLVWSAGRKPFADTVERSYSDIQAAVHCCRATVAKAIRVLTSLGLIEKRKQATLVQWGTRGRQWVQRANLYRLIEQPDCESATQTGDREANKLRRGIEAIMGRKRPLEPRRTVAQQLRELEFV